MAYLVLEIHATNLSINDLNQRYISDGTNPPLNAELFTNLMNEIISGRVTGTIQATSKDVTSSVTTSGSGSLQKLLQYS